MTREVRLDLNAVNLYAWEPWVHDTTLEAFLEGIRHHDDLPAVKVKHLQDLDFAIAMEIPDGEREDGGHHRAVSHLLEKVPLKCEIGDFLIGESYGRRMIPIQQVEIRTDVGGLYHRQRCKFGYYRPLTFDARMHGAVSSTR